MFSQIAQDAIIAQDRILEDTTTGHGLLSAGATTGQGEEEEKWTFSGFGKALTTAAFAVSLSVASTTALTGKDTFVALIPEQLMETMSVAPALSEKVARYENVLFSYPARVSDIERNVSGDPIAVSLLVSVDGNDNIIRRPFRQLGFEVTPGMRLIVDGVERRGIKQLAFRAARPLQLDSEQEELLKSIVSAFKTGTDV